MEMQSGLLRAASNRTLKANVVQNANAQQTQHA
jgi:hypothetical protein